jgi:hypothetical protein
MTGLHIWNVSILHLFESLIAIDQPARLKAESVLSVNVCSCEGLRMSAHEGGAAHTGAGVRKPPRKPREGIRQAVRRELSIIECRTYFRFRSRGIFQEPRPRMRAQLWRYGTSIAKWGK